MSRRILSLSHSLLFTLLLPAAALAQDPVPGSLRVTKESPSAVRLSWTSAGATDYCVSRDIVPTPVTAIAQAPGLLHVDDPPTPGALPSVYYYDVNEAPVGGCFGGGGCTSVATLACGVAFAGDTSAGCTATTSNWTGCGVAGLSGPECAHSFTAPSAGDWTVTLSGLIVDLDVIVVAGNTSCDPAGCVASGDTSATFTALAGETFTILVDGRAGASGAYTLTVSCPAPPACSPAGAVACGAPISARTDAAAATDALGSFGCRPGMFDGQEMTYTFTATTTGDVQFALSGLSTNLDVFVLRDLGAGCDTANCVAAADTSATVSASTGDAFLVIIDGAAGSEGPFTLTATCLPPATTCAPAGSVACGDRRVGDTGGVGSSDAVSSYSGCSATGLDGRELVYSFSPGADDVVNIGLVQGAGALDLIVLRDDGGGCDPAATCLAFEDREARINVVAGSTYYIVIDGPSGAPGAHELAIACGSTQCASLGPIVCGALRQDDNANSGISVMDVYPCTGFDESGPEYIYEFIAAQDGDMSVTLTGLTAELDIIVMEDLLGCQADSCLAFGDSTTTFPITAGTRYHIAIEGRDGASGNYTVTFACNLPPQDCVPASNVDCATAAFSNNGAVGSTDAISSYPSCIDWDESGNEIVYQWIAPGDVTTLVSLSDMTDDLDVFILAESGSGCRALDCIAYGDDSASFDAVAGTLYFFVVDGRAGARGDFRLYVDCFPAPAGCRSLQTLTCGSSVNGSNDQPGSTDSVDQWTGCTPFLEDGPEVAYEFVATTAGLVDVALSGLSAELDLFVLRDDGAGCTSATCFTAGDSSLTFAAEAGQRYFVVVDGRDGAISAYTLSLACR